MANNASSRLLDILRQRCVGAPTIESATVVKSMDAQGAKQYGRKLDMLLPLFKAAFRCAVVRSWAAVSTGLSLILVAFFKSLTASDNSIQSFGITFAGCVFTLFGLIGVPGGTSFLKVNTRAGFHCSENKGAEHARNARIRSHIQTWLSGLKQCPYLWSGELCTVLPFFWNPHRARDVRYTRIWLKAVDGEHFASDWIFPPSGYDPKQPVVLLLTGLAPSEHWTKTGGFVADAAWHLSHRRGMTVVVAVSRGTMDTEVNRNLFHGALTADFRALVVMARDALSEVASNKGVPSSPIFAAGYSMGGIILANYCGQYGPDAILTGAVNFSGLYDSVSNMSFEYSASTWQVYLAYGVKNNFFSPRFVPEAVKRGVDIEKVMSRHVSSIVDFDVEFTAVYNGYKNVEEYYRDQSVGSGHLVEESQISDPRSYPPHPFCGLSLTLLRWLRRRLAALVFQMQPNSAGSST
eukprot:TRINITY_DN27516_c0_g1_i1.p1 TRINITY_DN27516_c0_g1~~TRINITY_DN27516_c0_g1_i1.p1  ORF type:complete len:464 (-),score=45.48 TRINITY_DN27516_c0_g1_i1:472-1863(-)